MNNRGLNYRLIIFLAATLFGIIFSSPTFLQTEKGAKVSLGLDLQGGLYMLLGVKTDEAIISKIKSTAVSIKYYTDDNRILIDAFRVKDDTITLTLLDEDEEKNLNSMFDEIGGLVVNKQGLNYTVTLSDTEKQKVRTLAVTQAVETIRNRLDQFGLAEPTVAKQSEEDILVEIPGVKTREDEQRVKELIAKPANLQLMAVDEDRNDRVNFMSQQEAAAYGDVIYPDKDGSRKYLLKAVPILDGSMLTDAKVGFDQNNRPMISFSLNTQGAKIFGDFTGKNVGKKLAIVLDNVVYSAPNIIQRIGGGSGQITGAFSDKEASDIAVALRSGALLAPVTMLEQRSVGPSLGADSIKASSIALVFGFTSVVLFMCFYYRMAGFIASIALVSNLVILIALIAFLGATLTLPGMAGIILTVGMGIDANVIINERIRELLRSGSSIRAAIEHGYQNAMTAIVDSNLTTVIVAMVLYVYGTGPIKGFAITLILGIFISMLTAILGTRGIYELLMQKIEKSKNLIFWFGLKNLTINSKIHKFMKLSTVTNAVSIFLACATIYLVIAKDLNYGIDFAGGTVVQVKYLDKDAPINEIRQKVEQELLFRGASVTEFGAKDEVTIRFQGSSGAVGEDIGNLMTKTLLDTGNFEIRRVDMVGPKVGDELRQKGIMAILVSLIAILVYVAFRFEWRFGVAAIVSQFHDVLLVIGVIALLRIDVNLEILGAVLTILGYSINDTIVVFDRIREELKSSKNMNLFEIIDVSITKTLSRTTLTSLTTLFVVVALLVFGGESIHGFSLVLTVGIIIGTYSSIFIAAPLLKWLKFDIADYRANIAKKEKAKIEKAKMRAQYEHGRI
ncbi:MAG: protein translocase subunit SecD [Campylobacteraceae bacterium]|jgi:preprotein translocase subunit SecD|nr:protein translocase subunit SecD [Campylobacteraceae bacterium]